MSPSFAQFEREIISERTRDKQWAARKKGTWTGGYLVLGYDLDAHRKRLVVNAKEARQVRALKNSVFNELTEKRFRKCIAFSTRRD